MLQIAPGFPLLETRISGSAAELQALERCQAGVDAPSVFGKGLANLGYEGTARGLAEFGEQLSGF